jgi:hypothetical protein
VAETSLSLSGAEEHSLGDNSAFNTPPQHDGQLAGQRHDPNLAAPLAAPGKGLPVPNGKTATWLVTQPTPSKLHEQAAGRLTACLADAQVSLAVTTGILCRDQLKIGSQVPAALEATVEHFGHQTCRSDGVDAGKPGQNTGFLSVWAG